MTSIRVNVYDLSKTNSLARDSLPCIYHTSVVVAEKIELYYGFLQYGVTGIDYANRLNQLPSSMKGKFYKTFPLGKTKKSYKYCKQIIERFKQDPAWLSDRYNVIYNNCHRFSFSLCEALLGRGNTFNYPMFVFDCEKIGHALYRGVISKFIDEDHPPTFLGKVRESVEPFRPSINNDIAPEILSF